MLPHFWKYAGWLLIATGTALSIFSIWFNLRITLPVFALFSYYIEKKFLATFSTNVTDEFILLSLLGGFLLVVFSREKSGQPSYEYLKGKALFKALFYNSILLLISTLFLYGQAFFAILVLNVFSLFIFYLVFYNILKVKEKKAH